MSKEKNSNWLKKNISIIPAVILAAVVLSWLPDSADNKTVEAKTQKTVKHKIDVNDGQKARFKDWALTTSVTSLTYPENSDWQIWITLSDTKHSYTTKENVETIAWNLAKAYKLQTGYNDLVIVTVWRHGKVYAKGKHY